MTFEQNIVRCHMCPHRQFPCNGPCVCHSDPKKRDIIEVAAAADCPYKLFKFQLAGKLVAKMIVLFGIKRAITRVKGTAICTACDRREYNIDYMHFRMVARIKKWISLIHS